MLEPAECRRSIKLVPLLDSSRREELVAAFDSKTAKAVNLVEVWHYGFVSLLSRVLKVYSHASIVTSSSVLPRLEGFPGRAIVSLAFLRRVLALFIKSLPILPLPAFLLVEPFVRGFAVISKSSLSLP